MQLWQDTLATIQNIYGLIDQFNLSVSALLAALVVFALALLFAVREMATWFFKVNDLKRDLARLHEITLQLEGELKLVQNLVLRTQTSPEVRSGEPADSAAEPTSQPSCLKAVGEEGVATTPFAEYSEATTSDNATVTASVPVPAPAQEVAATQTPTSSSNSSSSSSTTRTTFPIIF
jgi:hypothetical protein